MSERDRYIPGVPCWIDTTQPDPEAAVAFYSGLFGWEFEDVMPPDSPGRYFIARIRGGDVAAVGSQPEGGAQPAAWNTYVWVEDAGATADKVLAAGGTVLMEPGEVGPDSGRMAVFADPAGAAFCVWQPNAHRGATVVNEHGALNFNDLYTRDLEGAAFYGAVFGWEVLDLGGTRHGCCRDTATCSSSEPRDARENGRDGRSRAVRGRGREPPAHPRRPARPAGALGRDVRCRRRGRDRRAGGRAGRAVVVPPFDAPWVRLTMISDPQGATFTASKFVPENSDVAGSAGAATDA